MRSAELTKEQREKKEQLEKLVAWMESGFRRYADLCGHRGQELAAAMDRTFYECLREAGPIEKERLKWYRGGIHENIRIQICKYAKEFSRILRDEVVLAEDDDVVTLRGDLDGLMHSECPAVVIVELALACTSDYGVTISDLMMSAIALYDYLDNIATPGWPTYPRTPKRGVPLSIQFMQESLRESRASILRGRLAYFYLLLKHFGYTHDTLRNLLRAMQYVRRRVPAVADYLQTRGNDTFNSGALQRRVCRFFEDSPTREAEMQRDIALYLSDKTRVTLYP